MKQSTQLLVSLIGKIYDDESKSDWHPLKMLRHTKECKPAKNKILSCQHNHEMANHLVCNYSKSWILDYENTTLKNICDNRQYSKVPLQNNVDQRDHWMANIYNKQLLIH